MDDRKHNFSTKTALSFALLLILTCTLLIGTVTFARYQWEFAQASYQFVPASQRAVKVYNGHITQQLLDSGRLPTASGIWEQTGEGLALQFGVANGSLSEFTKDDQLFAIRVAASLAIEDPNALTISLSYTDESGNAQSVTGIPTPIAEGSFQHSAFGEGWVYSFLAGEDELRFSLKGSAFDYQNFTVTVTGNVPATLLDLQVTQLHAN